MWRSPALGAGDGHHLPPQEMGHSALSLLLGYGEMRLQAWTPWKWCCLKQSTTQVCLNEISQLLAVDSREGARQPCEGVLCLLLSGPRVLPPGPRSSQGALQAAAHHSGASVSSPAFPPFCWCFLSSAGSPQTSGGSKNVRPLRERAAPQRV